MNKIQIFNNPDFGEIRTMVDDAGKPLFCGKDVAVALGYSNPSKALSDHCKGGVTNRYPIVDALGRTQEAVFISEGDIYRLIFSSKLPNAEKFTDWVTEDVLPTIRKHGAYMTPETIEAALLNPDTLIKLATELKAEREKRLALEGKVEQDKPKVLFADAVAASHTSILIGDLAKLLRQNGIDIGQNRLFEKLREEGYLIKSGERRNMPTQRSMEMGIFEVKETTIGNPDGSVRVTKTTKVTGKGQQYFVNRFLQKAG